MKPPAISGVSCLLGWMDLGTSCRGGFHARPFSRCVRTAIECRIGKTAPLSRLKLLFFETSASCAELGLRAPSEQLDGQAAASVGDADPAPGVRRRRKQLQLRFAPLSGFIVRQIGHRHEALAGLSVPDFDGVVG